MLSRLGGRESQRAVLFNVMDADLQLLAVCELLATGCPAVVVPPTSHGEKRNVELIDKRLQRGEHGQRLVVARSPQELQDSVVEALRLSVELEPCPVGSGLDACVEAVRRLVTCCATSSSA